jgi:Family of unknown function (DUF5996)
MAAQRFPALDPKSIYDTREAVHAYAQVIGSWRFSTLLRRKHWWQLGIVPSVRGLSTGLIQAGIDFELELDLANDTLLGSVAGGGAISEPLAGRSAAELASIVEEFLLDSGIDHDVVPNDELPESQLAATPGYSAEIAGSLADTFRSVSDSLSIFRAGIPEETSPIHIWPHHFDLAMLWLPGQKIPGKDVNDEETSDKQMNFGFTLGDDGIPEPYFYISAYPLPEAFPLLDLPSGAKWHTKGFQGIVLPYKSLLENERPGDFLVSLWKTALSAARQHMLINNT